MPTFTEPRVRGGLLLAAVAVTTLSVALPTTAKSLNAVPSDAPVATAESPNDLASSQSAPVAADVESEGVDDESAFVVENARSLMAGLSVIEMTDYELHIRRPVQVARRYMVVPVWLSAMESSVDGTLIDGPLVGDPLHDAAASGDANRKRAGDHVVVDVCVDDQCDVVEKVSLLVGSKAKPAPAVRRVIAAHATVTVRDGARHTRTPESRFDNGEHARLLVFGQPASPVPAARYLSDDDEQWGQNRRGVVPVDADPVFQDEPGLVHAFHAVMVTPGHPISEPLIAALRQYVRGGATVVGDVELRDKLVSMRNGTATKESVFVDEVDAKKARRLITPEPQRTMVSVPAHLPLRAGPRGPLPIYVVEEGGGKFLEISKDTNGADIADALLAATDVDDAPAYSGYGDTSAASIGAASVLIAPMLPVEALLAIVLLWAMLVAGLLLRHRGRRGRRGFMIESFVVSAVTAGALLVVADVRSGETTTSEVVTLSVLRGADLGWEVGTRMARPRDRTHVASIARVPGTEMTTTTIGDALHAPMELTRTPDGGASISGTRDVAVVGTWARPMRTGHVVKIERAPNGTPTSMTNLTKETIFDVRVLMTSGERRMSSIGPGATIDLKEFSLDTDSGSPDSRRDAARRRVLNELSGQRQTHGPDDANQVRVLFAFDRGETIVGMDVEP